MSEVRVKKSVALSGVVAGDTALSTVGHSGNDLHYRGYEINDLAQNCEFEEVAYLILYGHLPTQTQLADKLNVSFPTLNSWINGKSTPHQKKIEYIDKLYFQYTGQKKTYKDNLKTKKDLIINKSKKIGNVLKKIKRRKDIFDQLHGDGATPTGKFALPVVLGKTAPKGIRVKAFVMVKIPVFPGHNGLLHGEGNAVQRGIEGVRRAHADGALGLPIAYHRVLKGAVHSPQIGSPHPADLESFLVQSTAKPAILGGFVFELQGKPKP